ncbi:MAG: hypothetical protein J6039_04615 [Alphaproteobacteria bacterium]|nr:hypothetical protein [Alphaproteobacteria bacterium]
MSELRKEIERQFKAKGLLPDNAENEAISGETEMTVAEAPIFEPSEEVPATVITAPPGYQEKFAIDFKNLPQEWQIFLCEREADNEGKLKECLTKLEAYAPLEEIFASNKTRLENEGFQKIQDWLAGLAWVDEALAVNPAATIQALAVVYGVKADVKEKVDNGITAETIARLCRLERNYHDLTSYIQEQQTRKLWEILEMFGRQTDADGNLLHPYFEDVKEQLIGLLNSGEAQDITSAYDNALWLNPQIREKLIEQKISDRAAEAEKAKKAAFNAKGKTEMPQRELTLREEIAKNMAAFMD